MQEKERRYLVFVDTDEDGVYIATAPAFPGVVEQGDTEEEAVGRMVEAITFTMNAMEEAGEEIPPSDPKTRTVREVELAV